MKFSHQSVFNMRVLFYYKFEYIWSQKRMEDISDMELDYCSLATNVTQMLENFKTKQATNIVVVIATV